ncbi:hypothetical protein [Mesorhizobium sp. 43Arga]
MPEQAGSVVVSIGGNLAPLEAAFAKARQMADLFDQQVSKKLGNTGASEAGLSKIAALIEQTNAMLAKMTGTVTTADASMNKFGADAEKASAAVDDVKASAASAAPAVGKLSSEFNSAASSIQRAVSANQQFTASNRALAAASNLKLADGTAASTAEMQAYAVALDDIRAKYNPLFAVTRQYLTLKDELRIATQLGALSETEAGAALSRNRQETLAAIGVLKGHTDAVKGHGAAAGLGASQMMALTHAVRSFTEQIALGASPLQALTAQMNHLSYVASGPGGVRGALTAIGEMAVNFAGKFAKVGLIVTGAIGGFLEIRNAASEAERRTVGFGETFVALIDVIKNNAVGQAISAVWAPISYALDKLGSAAVDIGEVIINSFVATYHDVEFIWSQFPNMLGNVFVSAANFGIDALNLLVKKTSDSIDSISSALNRFGASIPLLLAPKDAIEKIANPYAETIAKANADNIARTMADMQGHPLRDFAKDVVDRIQTNHALEGLDALANVDFGKSIGGATGLGNAIGGIGSNASGVTVTIGGMAQQVINVTKAFEDAKRAQLGQLVSAQQNLVQMKQQATELQQTLAAAGQKSVSDVFGSFFSNTSGARQAIADAASGIDNLFKQWDAGRESAKALNADIEKIRQTMLAMGGDPKAINAFIDSVVNGQLQVRQLNSNVKDLSTSIRTIPNKTVTITVKTQQVGSGTQSLYDVPGGQVGVTRYGGVSGQQSGPSMSAYSVPSTGYGSQGGYDGGGTSTVGVTRFSSAGSGGPAGGSTYTSYGGWQMTAPPGGFTKGVIPPGFAEDDMPPGFNSGGMIHPGDTQQVSFFKSPDETVGIFTPGQMDALANPQSGFTGTQPTANDNRGWTVLMNIEASTRKTAQLLDDINTRGASVASSGGSSGASGTMTKIGNDLYDSNGLNAGGHTADQVAAYTSILKSAMSNYSAIGGMGLVGYGANGLAATPQQIAANLAYKGGSPVGIPSGSFAAGPSAPTVLRGGDPYNAMLNGLTPGTAQYAQVYAQALAASNKAHGFNSGGMIAPGDSQEVRFFKSPEETVAIFTPQQMSALRGENQNQKAAANDSRPISFNIPITVQGGSGQVSNDSIAEIERRFSLALRKGLRSLNGR